MFKFYACALFMLLGVHLQAVVVVNELEESVQLHNHHVYDERGYGVVPHRRAPFFPREIQAGCSVEMLDIEEFYVTMPESLSECRNGRAIYPVTNNSVIRIVKEGNLIKVIHENRACECGKK